MGQIFRVFLNFSGKKYQYTIFYFADITSNKYYLINDKYT